MFRCSFLIAALLLILFCGKLFIFFYCSMFLFIFFFLIQKLNNFSLIAINIDLVSGVFKYDTTFLVKYILQLEDDFYITESFYCLFFDSFFLFFVIVLAFMLFFSIFFIAECFFVLLSNFRQLLALDLKFGDILFYFYFILVLFNVFFYFGNNIAVLSIFNPNFFADMSLNVTNLQFSFSGFYNEILIVFMLLFQDAFIFLFIIMFVLLVSLICAVFVCLRSI